MHITPSLLHLVSIINNYVFFEIIAWGILNTVRNIYVYFLRECGGNNIYIFIKLLIFNRYCVINLFETKTIFCKIHYSVRILFYRLHTLSK